MVFAIFKKLDENQNEGGFNITETNENVEEKIILEENSVRYTVITLAKI
jgi:hypothetical protein